MHEFAKNLRVLRKQRKLNQEALATPLGVKSGTVSNYENGVSEPNIDQLVVISQLLKVSIDDLVKSKNIGVAEDVVAYQPAGIPLIPFEAAAGNGPGTVTILDSDVLGRFVIPNLVADFIVQVKDTSMIPNYRSGDMVACHVVKDRSLFQWGRAGRAFVLHHRKQGTMMKRLFPTKNEEIIECRSDNPYFPPFNVNTADIDQFAMVVALIRAE